MSQEETYEDDEYSEPEDEPEDTTWKDMDDKERAYYKSGRVDKSTKGQYSEEAHLKEVIGQRNGGAGSLPTFVIDTVLEQHKIFKHMDLGNERHLRFLLKQGGERTYYEHAPQMALVLANKKPKFLGHHEQQEAIQRCFVEAKQAWKKAPLSVKGKRRSMPPYKDWLRRICLMLGLRQDANSLVPMKNPSKIREINKIWEYFGRTCEWEDWEYGLLCEYQ